MVGQTSTLARSLHAHLGVVDQPSRAVLCRTHRKQIRRGVHRSTRQLEQTIRDYIETVSADHIFASIKRFCLATLKIADNQAKIVKSSESGH
jgi:hypothetical protein